jgi:hypothetical protein
LAKHICFAWFLTFEKYYFHTQSSIAFTGVVGSFRILAALCLAKTVQRGREVYKVKSSLIKLHSIEGVQRRIWHLDLSSFEAVHGMSRVVKLIPDKLATATAINLENLPNPEDNGTFLVDLVTQLLEFFEKLVVGQESRRENDSLLDGENQVNSFVHSG